MNSEVCAGERLLGSLLERSSLIGPDSVPELVANRAGLVGASDVVLYLVDYDQVVLVPLVGPGVPERAPLSIDATLGGRAFRQIDIQFQDIPAGWRLWIPLLDGTERIGVMELTVEAVDELFLDRCRHLAGVAAELLVSKGQFGDIFELARRTKLMSLAAEIQWRLLPPLTFGTNRVVISGVLQPAYEVGGDAFDYALNGATAHLAVLDAMGHGLEASLLAAVAIGAYRSSRRRCLSLEATYAEIDEAVGKQFGAERFATGLLAELDVTTGNLRWLNAGHPEPLLVRRGRVVKSLECPPSLPLGLGGTADQVVVESLEPGDRVLFYTDGVVEARSSDGEFFGLRRLADMLSRETASAQPAPETMRRLSHAVLDHQEGTLQDDATMLFLEWVRSQEDSLVVE